MNPPIVVYGKEKCDFTQALREDLDARGAGYVYHDVVAEPDRLEEMLRLSGGRREVPVIVRGEKVIVGYPGTCSVD